MKSSTGPSSSSHKDSNTRGIRLCSTTRGKTLLTKSEIQAQKNMGRFIKILLVKRLDSSFHAFRNSIARFIANHERFLRELDKGNVYVSKKYMNKIFELLDNEDDEEAIQQLLESDKARKYPAEDFKDDLKKDLENDRQILNDIQAMWLKVTRDPKLLAFVEILSSRPVLKENKLIVFTESAETADYLAKKPGEPLPP